MPPTKNFEPQPF